MTLRSDPHRLRGSITPLITPFTAEGEVDHAALANLVRWQLAHGTHGLSIGGSTGEPSSQTIAERLAAIRTVVETVDGRVPVVPGTGSAKLDETIELTAAAAELGVAAVLIISPYYARPTQEALYVWYKTVADAFPELPVLAYNVPVRTAVDVAPATIARLFRDVENFVGVKETTRDFEHFSRVIQLCGPDVIVWSGIELLCLPLLALGGTGFLSATANIAPAAHVRMYEAWLAGDLHTAREIHYGLHPLVDLLFTETNPAPVKWVLAQRGLIASGYVRPPLIPATPAAIGTISGLLTAGEAYLTPADGFTTPADGFTLS